MRVVGFRLAVEDCAQEYINLIINSRYSRIFFEVNWDRPDYVNFDGGEDLDVYVKSVSEISIDEIPILAGIVKAFGDKKLYFYEYESIHKDAARYKLAADFVKNAMSEKRSFIMVIPVAFQFGLANQLPKEYWPFMEDIMAGEVVVEYDNPLYLPRRPVERPFVLVAKRNSLASYERVEWLSRKARSLDYPPPLVTYFDSNSAIFRYVTKKGVRGLRERVPVNKLAGHIVALDRCLDLGVATLIWRRGEQVSHLVYAYGVEEDRLERLKREIEGFQGRLPTLTGLLYDSYKLGVLRIQSELVKALDISL